MKKFSFLFIVYGFFVTISTAQETKEPDGTVNRRAIQCEKIQKDGLIVADIKDISYKGFPVFDGERVSNSGFQWVATVHFKNRNKNATKTVIPTEKIVMVDNVNNEYPMLGKITIAALKGKMLVNAKFKNTGFDKNMHAIFESWADSEKKMIFRSFTASHYNLFEFYDNYENKEGNNPYAKIKDNFNGDWEIELSGNKSLELSLIFDAGKDIVPSTLQCSGMDSIDSSKSGDSRQLSQPINDTATSAVKAMNDPASAETKYSSTVYIYRQFSLLGAAVKWGVSLDNSIVANLATNMYVVLHVTPGTHTVVIGGSNIDLFVPGDNAAINAIINGDGSFTVKPDDTVFIRSKGAKVQFVRRNEAFENMIDMVCGNCGPNESLMTAPEEITTGGSEKPSSAKPVSTVKLKATERWPHKGCLNIEISGQLGANLLGMKKLYSLENDFLESLGLYEYYTNSSGDIVSTEQIDSYEYSEDFVMTGAKALFFITNKTGLGLHFFNCEATQEIKALGKKGSGSLVKIYVLGPSAAQVLFHTKKRFGISLRGDVGYAFGKIATIPALDSLRKIDAYDNPTIDSIILAKHAETKLSGVQGDIMITADLYIAKWFSINGGLSLYLYYANAEKRLWPEASTTFRAISPTFCFGVDFYLFNRQPE